MSIVILGDNCFVASILRNYGLRKAKEEGEKHLPFDYIWSGADAVSFYLNTNFNSFVDDFMQNQDGKFYNKRASIACVHENEPESNIRTLDELKKSYTQKVADLQTIMKQGETIYFIRHENYYSMDNIVLVLKALRRFMSCHHQNWKLLWLCHEGTRERTIRLSANCEIDLLPVVPNFEKLWSDKNVQNTDIYKELMVKFGSFIDERVNRKEIIRTEVQKTIIPSCRCAFFPVEMDGTVPKQLSDVNLTLGAIVRDKEDYIQEWLAFHKLVGFGRFVIALHQCSDRTEEKINQLPFRKDIHIHHVTNGEQLAQMGAYQWIIDRYGKYTHWLSFLDSDEFLYGTKEDNLNVLLQHYDDYGGLIAHWKWFGANDHVVKPKGLILENYTRRATDDYVYSRGIKSVFKPACLDEMISSHRFYTTPECVREDGRPIPKNQFWEAGKPPLYNVIAVNHYKTGCMEDWIDRYRRGNCNEQNADVYGCNRFKFEDRNDKEDLTILRFVDGVRKILRECHE